MTVLDLPPLTGSPIVDPWRIRHRLELAGELQIPQVERSPAVTRSEQVLWELLEHEPPGWQREYSTGLYRLDFYCPTARLAIEVDGGSHYGREAGQRDALRDQWHRARGITTKRFSAREVEQDPTWVLDEIGQLLGIKEADQDDVVDEEVEGRSVADSSAADGILEEAQDLEEQLRTIADSSGVEASLAADVRVEGAVAEACRTVLPKQHSKLRQLAELFEQ